MKIVIWTGPAWETWGADSLLTGIGGSEAAAVYISRELARLGHEVEVVGMVRPSEVRYGSGVVRFVDFTEYHEYSSSPSYSMGPLRLGRGRMECDVFVSSRYLTAINKVQPDCRLKVLWMHDVHAGPDRYRFPSETLRSFHVARVKVDGECPELFFDRFAMSHSMPVCSNTGVTATPVILKSGSVLEVTSTNVSDHPAKMTCGLVGFVEESS
jgi:hypothetical protein